MVARLQHLIHRLRAVVVALALAAASSACHAEPEPAPPGEAREADPNVVVNAASAWEQLPVVDVDPAPVLEVGGSDAPGHALRDVVAATIASDMLLVADGASAEVRAFAGDGRLLRRYGGRRGGAGDTETIRAMQLAGDTLFVFDGAGRSMHAFSLGGDHLFSASLVLAPAARYRLKDGSLAGVAPGDETADSATGVVRTRAHILHHGVVRADADTVASFLAAEAWVSGGASGGTRWVVPFGRSPGVRFAESGAIIACEDGFAYRLVPWSGGSERTVRVDAAPVRVTALDVARYRDAWNDHALAQGGAFARRFGTLPSDIYFRETRPACGDVLLESDGSVWIAEYVIPGGVARAWTVFGSDGGMTDRVRTPPDYRIVSVGGDGIVGVRTGRTGGDRVAVFRR